VSDLLLNPRHALERQLEPQVSTRHHHRVAFSKDLLQPRDGFRTLELGDELDIRRARPAGFLPGLPEDGRTLHEAQGHEIDRGADAETQIADVLLREARGRELHAGHVDALVLPECSSLDDDGAHLLVGHLDDAQLDSPVVYEQGAARMHARGQAGVTRRHAGRVAGSITDDDPQLGPRFERHRSTPAQRACADLRAAQVLKDGHDAPRLLCRAAHVLDRNRMALTRAVGEIETEDIDAGCNQLVDDTSARRRWAECRDDLGPAHEVYKVR